MRACAMIIMSTLPCSHAFLLSFIQIVVLLLVLLVNQGLNQRHAGWGLHCLLSMKDLLSNYGACKTSFLIVLVMIY